MSFASPPIAPVTSFGTHHSVVVVVVSWCFNGCFTACALRPLGSLVAENELRHFLKLARLAA